MVNFKRCVRKKHVQFRWVWRTTTREESQIQKSNCLPDMTRRDRIWQHQQGIDLIYIHFTGMTENHKRIPAQRWPLAHHSSSYRSGRDRSYIVCPLCPNFYRNLFSLNTHKRLWIHFNSCTWIPDLFKMWNIYVDVMYAFWSKQIVEIKYLIMWSSKWKPCSLKEYSRGWKFLYV